MKISRLGVLSALPQELGDLCDQLDRATTVEKARRHYHCGRIGETTVVATTARIGKVAAASTTTTLIQHFEVDAIVFVGVAGGLGCDISVGDVVLASELLQHDLSAAPLFPPHEIPLLGMQRIPTDSALTGAVRIAAGQAIRRWQAQASHPHFSQSELHEGLIISGDQFIHQPGHAQTLLAAFPDALAVEMEGAAVAQVCWEHGTPFAVIRTISDRADAQAPVAFDQFLSEVAAPMSSGILRSLFDAIAGSSQGAS